MEGKAETGERVNQRNVLYRIVTTKHIYGNLSGFRGYFCLGYTVCKVTVNTAYTSICKYRYEDPNYKGFYYLLINHRGPILVQAAHSGS